MPKSTDIASGDAQRVESVSLQDAMIYVSLLNSSSKDESDLATNLPDCSASTRNIPLEKLEEHANRSKYAITCFEQLTDLGPIGNLAAASSPHLTNTSRFADLKSHHQQKSLGSSSQRAKLWSKPARPKDSRIRKRRWQLNDSFAYLFCDPAQTR